MDTLFREFEPGTFITFIGLCIATFAFLSSYLAFPKNLISKLQKNPQSGLPTDKINITKILHYFYSMDLITTWILFYLILCLLSSCLLLIVDLQLAMCLYPYFLLRMLIVFFVLECFIIMAYAFLASEKLRGSCWYDNEYNFYPIKVVGWLFLSSSSLLLIISSIFFELVWFFLSLVFLLIVLFLIFITLLASYTPLTALVDYLGISRPIIITSIHKK